MSGIHQNTDTIYSVITYMKTKDKKHKKQIEEVPDTCEVCKGTSWEKQCQEKLKCQICQAIVHKNCYAPEFKDKDKSRFKCDPCKKRNSKNKEKQPPKYACSHCEQSSGLLKELGNQEWMHVLCALTSPRTHLQSYLSLNFAVDAQPHKHINKARKCICKSERSQGLPCRIKDCKRYIHLICVVNTVTNEQEFGPNTIIGLLDKNQGTLLYRLALRKTFAGLLLIPCEKEQPRSIVCQQHNSNGSFQWCLCNNESKSNEDMAECQNCKRWYHQSCMDFPKHLVCKGCKDNDIFSKNVSLPELIGLAAEVEKQNQLDKHNIKFLDHFWFKLSEHMQRLIGDKKYAFEIQRYFLRQYLDQYYSKQIEDEKSEAHKLQILHYLLRRQKKQEHQITAENLEEMLTQLSGKCTKFQWSAQKIEKTEKKYKDFISFKLKRMQNDGIRQIRIKLAHFEKVNRQTARTVKDIALDLYPILQQFDQSETWQTLETNVKAKGYHQLFHFFSGSQLSKQHMVSILKGIKKLLLARNQGAIDESDLYSIIFQKYDSLNDEKVKCLKNIYTSLLKGVKQRKVYESRRELLKSIQNKYQQSTVEEKTKLRNTAISNGIMISCTSSLHQLEAQSIELEICKRKFLKNYNPPNPFELGQALNSLQSILAMDQRVGTLKKSDRQHFQQLGSKYSFYHSSISYVQSYQQQFSYPSIQPVLLQEPRLSENNTPQMANHRIQHPRSQQMLEEKLRETLNDWPNTLQAMMVSLSLLREASKRRVKWSEDENEMLSEFFDTIVQRIQKLKENGHFSVKSTFLCQIKQISTHLNVQQKYATYIENCIFFQQWKQQLEENFKNIEKILETPEKCNNLLQVIQTKMTEVVFYSSRIDLSVEVRKLKILRMWALFSQKLLVPERSTTITAIQSAKTLMDKIQYPKNGVRKEIERLDQEAKSLNKRINRFLEKSKLVEMEFYEQLRFMQSKMTLKEAKELQKDLQGTELDVEIQLNQLKDQILNAHSLFDDFDHIYRQAKHSETLSQLRKQLLESPFLVCNLSQYETILRKYYSFRCLQYNQPVTKNQYFKLLNNGGCSAAELLTKTQSLFNIYKEIEVAQKEMLSSKPRAQHLLTQDIKKYRTEFIDQTELNRIERYFSLATKLKNQFLKLKQERAEIERYNQLHNDIMRLPINCSQTTMEINRMKKQLEELSSRIKHYLPNQNTDIQSLSYDSPFTANVLLRYQKIDMSCETMETFEKIVSKYMQLSELYVNISFDNYKLFSTLCFSLPELWSNDELYQKRQKAFGTICEAYLQHSEPFIQVGCALLTQGGFLIKRPKIAEKILPTLSKVNKKLYKWERPNHEREDGVEEGEEVLDSGGLSQDDDLDDQVDIDIDNEDLDDIDLSGEDVQLSSDEDVQQQEQQVMGRGNGQRIEEEKSRKRPRPKHNEFVISDDD